MYDWRWSHVRSVYMIEPQKRKPRRRILRVEKLRLRSFGQLTKVIMEDDSEMAFKLQLEEAIAASLIDGGTVSPPNTTGGDPYEALIGCEQEFLDDVMAEVEAERLRLDLLRQVHDRALACEIMSLPDEEWAKTGDNLHRPFGEGSSSSSNGQNFNFKVYVKGLVEGAAGGIGAAICAGNDGLLFELSKCLSSKDQQTNKELVDFRALIEGLDAAAMLDLKRITIVTDNRLLYQHVGIQFKLSYLSSL